MEGKATRAAAIVGVGAILPDAPDAPSFWKNICSKRYSITEVPPDRWRVADYYDPDPNAPDKTYSKIGAWVRGFEFDWKRFRIPPRVTAAMDQSQQWAVAMADQVLTDYGYPQRPLDLERTGVILGTAMGGEQHYLTTLRIEFPEYARALESVSDFSQLSPELRTRILDAWRERIGQVLPPITEDAMPGELANIVAGRVANVHNLRGPGFVTDAACASSFAAVAAAVDLLYGAPGSRPQCDAVLTGGVDRNMGVSSFVKFCKIGALSATGTRPFGDGADGFVMGEGGALFLLKRLADAERDGDHIYAVIRGVGGSSDGKGKGITAPNPAGQQLAVRRAWEGAGLDPGTATLIEAHGTSTRVGDLVEAECLTRVFDCAPRGSIALGSAKSNIGHLKAGAGAAGLLKAVMALNDHLLPPTLHGDPPNPSIDFASSPLYLNHELREWERPANYPRRAGASAFGFGGTNFHVVLEEHVPGMLTSDDRLFAGVTVERGDMVTGRRDGEATAGPAAKSVRLARDKRPVRGILTLGAPTVPELKDKLAAMLQQLSAAPKGWQPPDVPNAAELAQHERLVIDFSDRAELIDRLSKAQKALASDNVQAWKALQAQGIFRGTGPRPGKVAFLFCGQGSQYLNMGRELSAIEPVMARAYAEADRVMTPLLGKPLTEFIFVNADDPAIVKQAEKDLTQTAITQPAVLTMDAGLDALLAEYGFRPDAVMGHSLGEYGALVAAGVLPFAEAVEASAARGREMTRVSMDDNGWMAAVMASYDVVQQTLAEIDGYVVAANINSNTQCVIGGESKSVERAIAAFTEKGIQAQRIPVSHAFHTKIVAPAAAPMRQVLNRLHVSAPVLPLIANVTGDYYPQEPDAIRDMLEQQIASPVQWVKGLETLYNAGVRTFVEVGPKKALKGFVDDVLGNRPGVVSLFSNHPKTGELASFNHALCGLYAAGYGIEEQIPMSVPEKQSAATELRPVERIVEAPVPTAAQSAAEPVRRPAATAAVAPVQAAPPQNLPAAQAAPGGNGSGNGSHGGMASEPTLSELVQALRQLANGPAAAPGEQSAGEPAGKPYDRNSEPLGSIVITGTGLGLPGPDKPVMDPDNALRILHGEQFIDLIPERFRTRMVLKGVTRIVKGEDGSGHFETIDNPDEVIRLAGRAGSFDLTAEYGVPEKLVEALDITTQLAMAAGLDALREAGIPLVQTYKLTSKGTYLPERWMLPQALRDETGVIFASAFPGGDRMANEFSRYFTWESRRSQLEALEDLRRYTTDEQTLEEIQRRMGELRAVLEREPYSFDRRFLFRVLSMGHSQFAEYIGARGPNTQVNAACASTANAVSIAEDWIRSGRCRRVIVLAADNVTGDNLIEWVGAGFLASGAAATDDRVEDAAIPFDRRRHGTIMGMGACAMVLESEDAVRERGMRGIVELLAAETFNSAYHGTRLDVPHISTVMNTLVTSAERRFGINRYAIASQTAFVSHETFTPARGGSAESEVAALRATFGDAANEIIMTNTKGLTGHAMGAGVEDVIAIKILEYGIVPPVANLKEIDPGLGNLNLSRGGRYPVQYAIHLAAGFGSQIAMTLLRRLPGGPDRVDFRTRYERWLADVSGYDRAETEVVKRVLRVKATGAPTRPPAGSLWRYGIGPSVRAAAPGHGAAASYAPAPRMVAIPEPRRNGNVAHALGDTVAAPAAQPVTPAPAVQAAPIREASPAPVAEVLPPMPESAPAITPAPVAPEAATVGAGPVDPLPMRILNILSEKTGYPPDMMQDLDLDLEADLGIDTVKQAELFMAIRQEFEIPKQENLKLRDYPTLRRVIEFVRTMRPDLVVPAASGAATPAVEAAPAAVPQPVSQPVQAAPAGPDAVTARVLSVVAEKTGYPQDMLDLDLDLEADLGVDTVKQAETFMAIRQAFDIPKQDNLKLREYPTLKHVIDFVYQMRPDLAAPAAGSAATPAVEAAPAAVPQPVPQPVQAAPAGPDAVTARVLSVVAEKTGYPQDMLDLDLDLEADLGVDTVKQAETFMAIRQAFDIPKQDNLKLREYPTLKHVIDFVYQMRPDLDPKTVVPAAQPQLQAEEAPKAPAPAAVAQPAPVQAPSWNVADADRMPRRVPAPVLRPALELCKPTGVSLRDGSRVVVMSDGGGVGEALIGQLQQRGVTVLALSAAPDGPKPEAQIKEWLAEGPIEGVYWLPALDVEPDLPSLAYAEWRAAVQVRVKNLYAVMRALYESISSPWTFLVSATRLGGLHGYGPVAATAPLGGAVTGFTKAYKRERVEALVKAVDFETGRAPVEVAETLIAETLHDPGLVEVGCYDGLRYGVTLVEQPASDGQAGMQLGKETVFAITGAAGGITSAIVSDLAIASGGIFYLLDLAPLPERDSDDVRLYRTDKEALKQKIVERLKAAGERPTPVKVDKQVMAVERSEAALRAVESVEAAGGTAHYYSLNLLDPDAVAGVMADIRQQQGRIDVLVHAGGIEISRALPDKEAKEFDLVFDVKAEGLYNLLNAAQDLPIGATVAFSSVAGRFGNSGQTDYSAANDFLCKVTSSMRNWRPETRGIVIDWTAWAGIGMASRGSIPKIMEMAGIDMLPPEAGVPTVRRELTSGARRGEIVVGQRLGVMVAEADETGGLDSAKVEQATAWPMIGTLKATHLYRNGGCGGFEVETTLDPQVQPFLRDHAMEGVPLLPGVMGTEAFAELASLVAPGYGVVAVENESFLSPFKFYHCAPRTLHLAAHVEPLPNGELLAHTVLRSVTPPAREGLPEQVKEHFTADVRLARSGQEKPVVPFQAPATETFPIDDEAVYRIYFHGPAYRVLDRARVEGTSAVGLMTQDLPADLEPADKTTLMAPRLIELCFQTAGIWQIATQETMALPAALKSVTCYRQPAEAEGRRLYAEITALEGAEFDARVVDEAGNVYVALRGYRTVQLPGKVQLG